MRALGKISGKQSGLAWLQLLLLTLGLTLAGQPELRSLDITSSRSAQAETLATAQTEQQKLRQAEEIRQYALDLVNQDRRAKGLRPLVRDVAADQAAQHHAQDMLRRNFFDHLTPEGHKPRDRYRMAGGRSPLLIGENIFWIEDQRLTGLTYALAIHLQKGWMESPDHREIILTAKFTGFGYGIAYGSGGQIYAVQTFTAQPQ